MIALTNSYARRLIDAVLRQDRLYSNQYAITGNDGTDVITATGHTFVTGDAVRFHTLSGGSNITADTLYYVRATIVAGTSFQIETTVGGGVVSLGSNITAGYCYGNNKYLGFFKSAPGKDGGGTEVSTTDTGYARVRLEPSSTISAAITANDISTGKNGSAITVKNASSVSGMGTITHWGIWDAATSGNLIAYGDLTAPKTVGADDTLIVSANDFQFSI